MTPNAFSLLLSLVLLPCSSAQELSPGKPAPQLQVGKWVKGAPIASLAKDHVYVVEFWATWCGPCIAGMPHLSRVQKKHAGALTVIGVTSEDENNSLAAVEKMVAEKGDTMAYTVAWDDGQKTQKSWFEAARQNGIPCCFVVDKAGIIAWIGHPQWLDVLLPDVLAGTSDPKVLAAKVAAIEKRMTTVFAAAQVKPAKAFEEAKALLDEYPCLGDQVEEGMFGLMLGCDDLVLVWPLGEKLVARAMAAKDADALNTLAWAIVDPGAKRKDRNLDLAARAATKATELTARKDPNVLDTLARVHAWKNEWKEALSLQQEALKLLPLELAEVRAHFEAVKAEYEAKRKAAGG